MHEYGILGADKGGIISYHGCPEFRNVLGLSHGPFVMGPQMACLDIKRAHHSKPSDDREAEARRQVAEPLFAAQDIKRLRPDCALLTPWDAKVYRDVN